MTKKGTLIYQRGKTTIRDDGDKLSLASDADMEGLTATLKISSQRYGQILIVAGSDTFKKTYRASRSSRKAGHAL
jgi:Large polyvalent protein-associated domain 7